jgi:sugar phosphate isomerase/epimerase
MACPDSLPGAFPVSAPVSLKGRFPFSFGVTSYLYPADIASNIERLRGLADEMELILFESGEATNIPSPADIGRFRGLADGMRFNVHLPLDIDVVSPDPVFRAASLDMVARLVELTTPLDPTSWTLHVLREGPVEGWRDRVYESLRRIGQPRGRFCVETLQWDLREIDDILRELDFSVCIDAGHLLLYRYDVAEFFRFFAGRISMVHLHGVKDGRDHLPLSALDGRERALVAGALRAAGYARSACLEVFDLQSYTDSVPVLREMFSPAGEE